MKAWQTLTVAAIAGWLGVMSFFSFLVAPLAFRVIDRTAAAQVVTAVLPRYYVFGLALCALALVGILARAARGGARGQIPTGILCLLMLAMLTYSLGSVVPAAEAARAAGDHVAFVRAHRLSVGLNLATILGGVLVLVLEAFLAGASAQRGRRSDA